MRMISAQSRLDLGPISQQSLVKEHFEHMKVEKEKETLKDGLGAVQKGLASKEAEQQRCNLSS